MSWVQLDDHFDDDTDLLALSTGAVCLYICMMSWVGRHLTDGKIPQEIAKNLKGFSKKSIAELTSLESPWIERIDGFFVIRNYLKYNPSKEEIELKKADTAERVRRFRESRKRVTDSVTEDVTKRVQNTSSPTPTPISISSLRSDIEKRAQEKPKKETVHFEKPSLERCLEFASELNLPAIEAEKFWNYYESNGWKAGRNPMRHWQAAMRGWQKRLPEYSTHTPSNGRQSVKDVYQESLRVLEEMNS